MSLDANRAHAWAAAAMRNAEGFVQVHMRHVRAYLGRLGNANLSVEIRAVHINLAAVVMNNLARLLHTFFVHAVCRRVGDHEGGEVVAIRFGLSL